MLAANSEFLPQTICLATAFQEGVVDGMASLDISKNAARVVKWDQIQEVIWVGLSSKNKTEKTK